MAAHASAVRRVPQYERFGFRSHWTSSWRSKC